MNNVQLLGCLGSTVLAGCTTFSPPFEPNDTSGDESVATMEALLVNGQKQWVFVRGRRRSNPLLLVLHGGPGTTMAPHLRTFVPELEEDFLVAHWEQRGAGKTYATTTFDETFTVEQMIADTTRVTELLLERYGRDRLFVLAGSWGTFLGMNAIQRRPDLYRAYFGVGQIVHQARGEELSYDYAMAQAVANGDTDAVERLEAIGRPPYPAEEHVDRLLVQRRVLRKYGGAIKHAVSASRIDDPKLVLFQEEYDLFDKINWVRGQKRSEALLGPVFRRIDLRRTIASVKVPVYLFQGESDWQTPTVLVREYFETLAAPQKELHVFGESAHMPIFEEPERFVSTLRRIVTRDFAGTGGAS